MTPTSGFQTLLVVLINWDQWKLDYVLGLGHDTWSVSPDPEGEGHQVRSYKGQIYANNKKRCIVYLNSCLFECLVFIFVKSGTRKWGRSAWLGSKKGSHRKSPQPNNSWGLSKIWGRGPGSGISLILTKFFFVCVFLCMCKVGFPGGPVLKNPPTKQEIRVWSLGW